MSGGIPTWKIWAAIVAIGALTFGIRFSFIYLLGRVERVPPRLEHALGFVPAAVLSALAIPAFISLEPTLGGTVTNPKLVAGIVAAAVAWRVDDMAATLAAGMGTLWLVQFGL